jgi:hypothetical protein
MADHERDAPFVCYECKDGNHADCIGVPCTCAQPDCEGIATPFQEFKLEVIVRLAPSKIHRYLEQRGVQMSVGQIRKHLANAAPMLADDAHENISRTVMHIFRGMTLRK